MLRWFAWLSVVLLLAGIVGFILGYRAVRSYLRSDDFRVMVGGEAGGLLGGTLPFLLSDGLVGMCLSIILIMRERTE